MNEPIVGLADFRDEIKRAKEHFPHLWQRSRKYLTSAVFQKFLPGLIEQIRTSSLESHIAEQVTEALQGFRSTDHSEETTTRSHEILREITGLPPSKAVRAIMVWGQWRKAREAPSRSTEPTPEELRNLLQRSINPYDVLLNIPSPSLLDIGAGDLSFEQELVEYYRAQKPVHKTGLTLHAFDRLHPGSKVGGVYHRDHTRERFLKSLPPDEVQFCFWGNTDLESFLKEKQALPRYSMVTCHAPANPTFAYEPSRLEPGIIQAHLRATRGDYRQGKFEGEPVLEVSHRGRVLTFPRWKFEIIGPWRLLEFMMRRASVCVLSAVDDEIFWELLGQLLAAERYRPQNRILTPECRPQVFGEIYERLQNLASGERLNLSSLAPLRKPLPGGDREEPTPENPDGWAFVEIRRGAVFPGVPSSFTAKQFENMKEEGTPWWMIMVPSWADTTTK